MIKLSKEPQPQVLIDNAAAWTKIILDKVITGEEPTIVERARYRHRDIKASLLVETAGKCAYCESKLLHITYGDVEHIMPKSSAPELAFEWANLTLACDVCNTNKGDKFRAGIGFVDPYGNDPIEYFLVFGPLIFARPGNDEARLTEQTLKLNRSELVERRGQKICSLREQLEVIVRVPEPLKTQLMADLHDEYRHSQEYSAIAKAFIMANISFVSSSVGAAGQSDSAAAVI